MHLKHHAPLKHLNTFGVAATAKYFAQIDTVSNLQALFKTPVYHKNPKLIIGGGSNVLFSKNFDGLVLYNHLKGIDKIRETEEYVWIKAFGGEDWHALVNYCIDREWAGIENLSLIPGSVGAAPLQNIGAYGVELKDVFSKLEAFHLESGELHTFSLEDCAFGYRESVFKKALKGCYFVLSVTLRLNKTPDYKLEYGAIKQQLEEMQVKNLTIRAVSNAICIIRQKKLPDPKKIGNAGSFFKNPIVSNVFFERLKECCANSIPFYHVDEENVKIPAGWLIEQCGWKGKQVGQTGAYKNQALVLVNYGKATGSEILALATDIQRSVWEKFKIQLEREVNVI